MRSEGPTAVIDIVSWVNIDASFRMLAEFSCISKGDFSEPFSDVTARLPHPSFGFSQRRLLLTSRLAIELCLCPPGKHSICSKWASSTNKKHLLCDAASHLLPDS